MSKAASSQRPLSATAGLGLAALLGCALLLLSFARLLGDMHSAAFDMSIVASALTDPFWHTRLARNIVLFAVAILALHVGFGLLCWLLARLAEKAFPAARCTRRQWLLLWFFAGSGWLLLANAAHFAHSSLGQPWHDMADTPVLGMTPYAWGTAGMLAAAAAVLLVFLYRQAAWRRKGYLLAAGAALLAGVGFTWSNGAHRSDAASRPPNIVFLGVDSLRPDFVDAGAAPHVRAFLDGAVRMQDAVTPLARTFPSWISILTGRHPHTTGAFMNLLPPKLIHTGPTLPQILHAHGYRTYYSMDETRFANIDASYGFDRTLTSTIGGSDFVISWFADTPLSNMVMNSWLGALLFPHVHANRAAHVTYDPNSFVRRVAGAIDTDRPVFLVSHLTLPHWPYIWADSPGGEPDESRIPAQYGLAVRRADQQFGDLLAALERDGVLDNAIVVALSDHGEALGQDDDFMPDAFPGGAATAPKSWKWGHGTSVFSPTQYHVVLGIRAYGAARALFPSPAVRTEPVSLVDLTPTILDLLKIDAGQDFDGMSLAPLLRGAAQTAQFDQRIRFTETEYNPQGFLTTHLTASALAEAVKIYRLDSVTDRLLVRDNAIDSILASRQYAALLGKHAMAIAIPDGRDDGARQFIRVPGTNAADAARLRQGLRERFGIRFADSARTKPAS
ncbi:MAG TPA: sulfatase-like hydrolase/transferase [Steroidobacteraceae bacterium]|nr:sulfatase-like hydrolase/transferase [Steroidobacteraceae bacterium]